MAKGRLKTDNRQLPMADFKVESDAVSFWLRVKPRAPRDRLKWGTGGELVLELHAPAVEGAANAACLDFFAAALRVPKACVELAAGDKSRRKLLKISGRSGEAMKTQIETLAGAVRRSA
jgi:hypothetical protein